MQPAPTPIFKRTRSTLAVVAASGAIGFAIGWLARAPNSPRLPEAELRTPSVLPTAARPPAQPGRSQPAKASIAEAETTGGLPDRVATLRWLKSAGVQLSGHTFNRNGIDAVLKKLLGLTDAEEAALVAMWRDAEREMLQLRLGSGSSRTSEDGTTLWVDFPGIDPARTGQIYDKLVGGIRSTITPDQLALFNEYAGENFERLLDRYGLNNVRYEVNFSTQTAASGAALINFKRHYVDPSDMSSGWSSSTLTFEQISRLEPLLAPFLPPNLK